MWTFRWVKCVDVKVCDLCGRLVYELCERLGL